MTTVLITGIDGFTGRYLADELRSLGYTVMGLGHETSEYVFSCDLLDRSSLVKLVARIKPEKVVHLAGIAFITDGDEEIIYRTHIVGTRNLLEAVSKCDSQPSSVILASSANIYGNASVVPIDEDTTPAPTNDYAVSKLAMEYMARLWFDRLPITLVRPFNYTGVGQSLDFLLPKIIAHFKRRAPVLELGNLEVVRDFSDVRSVVKRFRLLLEAGIRGETFNICTGRGYSLLDVVQMMRDLTDFSPELRVNPAFVRTNEVHRLIGSPTKLDAAIGTIPDIPLQDTLRWMLEAHA